ncbi:MAG: MarR family winged helix-turn-helix transcriptional regulator [Solirubrobacteraceae bacterium]
MKKQRRWVGIARYTSYCCAVRSAEIQTDKPAGEAANSPTADELVTTLRAMSRALQTFLIAQARATGLPLLEFLVLIRAADVDGVITRDAGRELGLNTSTMTGLADRLENDNLIRRHRHPEDRRLLVLKATPRGRKAAKRTLGPVLTQLAGLSATLQPEQRLVLNRFIREVTGLVLQQAETTRPRPTRRAVARAAAP